jgi:LAO/AO transport system kinase
MVELGSLENVFVRSLASRGAMGGLARTAQNMADALDVAGFQTILFETMGVGQAEIDISRHADTVVVTLVPESGDGVQAMKAGMMEIADIFLLNKSDRAQADQIRQDLLTAIQLRHNDEWIPPVIKTIATQDAGIDEIIAAVDHHRRFQNQTGRLEQRRKDRVEFQLRQEIQHVWTARLGREECQAAFQREVAAIYGGEATLRNAAERILEILYEKMR